MAIQDEHPYLEEYYEEEEVRGPKFKAPRIDDLPSIIVYRDKDYVLVNKPAGISTLDERAEGFGRGMLRIVRDTFPYAQAAHRLDKETSGILAFALNPDAYRHLAMQFEHRQVNKVYHAVVNGVHRLEGIRVNLPILPMRGGYVVIDKQKGKEAETIFNTLTVYRKATLVACYPVTGRMHQIRIHLSCLQAPIVHDMRYQGKPLYLSELKRNFNLMKRTEEYPLIRRVALHARELHFTNLAGEKVMAEAPYPKDIQALLTQLEKNS